MQISLNKSMRHNLHLHLLSAQFWVTFYGPSFGVSFQMMHFTDFNQILIFHVCSLYFESVLATINIQSSTDPFCATSEQVSLYPTPRIALANGHPKERSGKFQELKLIQILASVCPHLHSYIYSALGCQPHFFSCLKLSLFKKLAKPEIEISIHIK